MKIIHVVGARPNFMKVAPIIEAFNAAVADGTAPAGLQQVLVHTGQHYDRAMSDLFFEELGLPQPDINLGVGSGMHGTQTGRIMEQFEQVLLAERPDLVMVVGDVNSTLACTVDAAKLGIPVAHVEAGLRSFDRTMPEEINRIVTDALADLLLTTDRGAADNLLREGAAPEQIRFVGNVMIDTLLKHRGHALELRLPHRLGLAPEGEVLPYALVTLHRPGNVDDAGTLRKIGEGLAELARRVAVLFPVHPRTRANIERFGLGGLFAAEGIRLLEPFGYLEFLSLMAGARLILTDSGGVQEESTILGVSCLTLRPNTERPVTIEQGSNRLVAARRDEILLAADAALNREIGTGRVPELWDGHAAERIVREVVERYFEGGPEARYVGMPG